MRKGTIAAIVVALVIVGIVAVTAIANNKPKTETSQNTGSKESVTIKGSDTEVQLVSTLAQEFTTKDKGGTLSVSGGGSGVGIAALINGEIPVANSSRKIKDSELQTATNNGLSVQEFILCRDGLSLITHPDNKISKLTIAQIGQIYRGDTKNWKDVGGPDAPITLYGRQSTSGTFTFFRDAALKGEYSPDMKSLEGTEAIVNAVASDKNGVGYVGVGYIKSDGDKPKDNINIVNVAKDDSSEAISPLNKEAIMDGSYALDRPIYQYLAKMPEKGSFLARFLVFENSDAGQALIEKNGFYPISNADKESVTKLLDKIK